MTTDVRFHQALAFAEKYVREKDKDPDTTVRVVGHSLGGLLAQYVALKLGVRAEVFDSAALMLKKSDIPSSLRNGGARQIMQFFLSDDPVHPLALFWFFAHDYGIQYKIPLAPGLGPKERGHSLEGLIKSLQYALNSSAVGTSAVLFPKTQINAPQVNAPPDINGCRVSNNVPCSPPSADLGKFFQRPPPNAVGTVKNDGGNEGPLGSFRNSSAPLPPGGVRPVPKPKGSAVDLSGVAAQVLQGQGQNASWTIKP
jgi:hypothetical protein